MENRTYLFAARPLPPTLSPAYGGEGRSDHLVIGTYPDSTQNEPKSNPIYLEEGTHNHWSRWLMPKHKTFTPCIFLPFRMREQVPAGALVYDVSSYADHPYCTLSPMWPHGGIPVPGMPGTTSDSVEGIWQGLKVIDGKMALRYFSGKGQKRGGKPRGHQYGDKLLKIVEAREKIYRVAYEWMLVHRADPELIGEFIEQAYAGVPQYFHDVSNNGNIGDPDEGWAHAAVLVQYLNRKCQTTR